MTPNFPTDTQTQSFSDIQHQTKRAFKPNQVLYQTRKYWPVAAVLMAIVISVPIVSSFTRKPEPATREVASAATVSVETVGMQPLNRQLIVNGSISAWDPLSIGSEISGLRIESVKVEEGNTVRKGQVLAELNSAILKAQLDQSRAAMKASQASLKKAIQPNRSEDIDVLKAALSQAKANVAQEQANLAHAKANLLNAEQNARRYAELQEQGAVSTQDTETRLTNLAVAKSDLQNAEQRIAAARSAAQQAASRLTMGQKGGRLEDVEIARANLAQIQADIRRIESQIAQTIIVAPDDGLIVKRDAHIGDITSAGKSLFSMVRGNRLELKAQVPDTDLSQIQPGQNVTITASGKTIQATVREISPLVDSLSRLATVRIDIPANSDLRPGMFVHGQLDLGEQMMLAVPAKAVLSRESQTFVYLLDGSHAKRQLVQIGSRTNDWIAITEGLKQGSQVIVAGAGFLKDGDVVTVAPLANVVLNKEAK